ncbi:PREDICTED: U-box domain-containing protein 18-like [Ipomoea nil]|uniref:U-box domain-containing protein 18-like n=1 Tax=Ipomoea nil TaxID=35883 RepID=UPI000901C91A|nr:PREDICTED: U-box domain-containing protein 18-like [Ipomoea nil]
MINKSNEYPRRILSFPAIRPSETVSFPSLIAALIHLGHAIRDYKSKTFFTNRKNANFLMRLVDDLLIFLQEIRNGDSRFAGSMVLSLSELHFLFQKVVFLLEDCTREDARIWMVAKSEQVSTQFRVVARAMAVALDVLPFGGSDEVREVVEFVRKQAMRFKFEVEFEDRGIMDQVLRILEQFERGVVPESSDLKWVLESLGIRSWSECQSGVRFLDSEICLEGQTEEMRDLPLLSGLMGFLIYCRCTEFEFGDVSTTTRMMTSSGGGRRNDDVIRSLNPEDFRCPITLELMTDPVTLSTGHTYDRSSILKWFKAGNHTCPITGERLINIDLVPNLALKQIIRQYCNENGIPFPESVSRNRDVIRSIGKGSVAMKLLASFLVGRLVAGTSEQQKKAIYEIRSLTKTSTFNRSCLSEAGAIPPLLLQLGSWDSSVQENSIAALLNLSKNSKSRETIAENGGLVLILDVLKEGLKMEARQHAAGALYYLASVEDYKAMIGENPEAIPSLVELVRAGCDHGKKNALVTIFSLLTCPENHWKVVSAGLVPVLIDLLPSLKREDLIADCLAVLSSLSEKLEGAIVVLYAGALPIVIDILNSCSSRTAKECCVSLLLALCINGGSDAVRVLVKNPSLMPPLYLLLTQGTSRASKKASSLIRLLQEFNNKTSSSFINPPLPQDQFVNVW